MSKLDQKIKGISQEIFELERKVFLLQNISFALKGGAGSGRYPAGSSGNESAASRGKPDAGKDRPAQTMFNFDQPKTPTPTPTAAVIPKIEPPAPTPKEVWDASEAARVQNDYLYGDMRQREPARPYVEPPKERTPEERVTTADLHAQSESNRIALLQNQERHKPSLSARSNEIARELQPRIDPLADPKVPLKPLPPPTVELPTSIIDTFGDEYQNGRVISHINDRGGRTQGPKPYEPPPRRSGPGFGGRPNRMWRR